MPSSRTASVRSASIRRGSSASRRVRDTAFRRWQGGETSAIDYIEAQKDYNEVVRRFRDALVRHRRSMLDLNTAVATRILP